MGAYLSFSRGAIACLLAGLAALVAFDRTRAQLRAAALALGAGALAGAAAAPFGAVRALHPGHATAQGLAVLALLAAVAAGRGARCRPAADERVAPSRLRAAPVVAVVVALALLPYAAVVLAERGGPSRDAAFGATNARLSDAGSHRSRYWRVALDVAADHPLAGAGPGAFAVEWLRRRTIDERVRNAHSLELQTLADLGLIGLALLAAALAAIALAARRRPTRRPRPRRRPRRRRADLGPARRPGLGLGDARRHPRRGRPRRAPAAAGPARRTALDSSATRPRSRRRVSARRRRRRARARRPPGPQTGLSPIGRAQRERRRGGGGAPAPPGAPAGRAPGRPAAARGRSAPARRAATATAAQRPTTKPVDAGDASPGTASAQKATAPPRPRRPAGACRSCAR